MKQEDYKDTYFYIESIRGSKKGSRLTEQDKIELGLIPKQEQVPKTEEPTTMPKRGRPPKAKTE